MAKKKKTIYILAVIPVILIILLIGWFFTLFFEGEKPLISLEPLPEYLSKVQPFKIVSSDRKRGLKRITITVNQEGREIEVYEKKFPFEGLLNRGGTQQFDEEISINPFRLNLAQGRLDLYVRVWDYSRRGGGDGNLSLIQHKMIVDTIPPAIRAVSRMHNINKGGTGLILYQASSDTLDSGLFVDDRFFPGFPVDENSKKGMCVAYFSVPPDVGAEPSIFLWAKDNAGNTSRATFYYHIRSRTFRKERINISDRFLKRVLPYFSFYPLNPKDTNIQKYFEINNDLRKKNHETLDNLREKAVRKRLWEGPFLRLKNAATMAKYADQRHYYYKGKKIDEKVHLGVDLASLANSPVQAANHGKAVFAGRLGIYGNTVVLDHGQGLTSLYGHLSKIDVEQDQIVKRGDVIAFTGQTGLAGGDHLHFSIMVNGAFVNPIEWWDSHWINDNINRKMALLQ